MKQIRRMLALLLTMCVLLGTCGALADTYREGDAGPEIMALKERMLELGYYSGTISHNRFNDTMTDRVKQLQKVNGLEQTGVVELWCHGRLASDLSTAGSLQCSPLSQLLLMTNSGALPMA